MSVKRRQLFVGVLDNATWTKEKLCAYFNKHGTVNDEQYVVDCQIMSYKEARCEGTSFAFMEFNDEACVDYCMSKRAQFNEEHGITIKRLLPDSIAKCQRLISSKDIVIRLDMPDPLFTEENIRAYFGAYGQILDLKMLDEQGTASLCLITFDDVDSTDRVLLDMPHDLNGQFLSIDKYAPPEQICSLNQYRCIDENNLHAERRWYSVFRNLSALMRPILTMHKTQVALLKYNLDKQMATHRDNLDKSKEELLAFENTCNDMKQNCHDLSRNNENLKRQIEEVQKKNEQKQFEYEQQIEEQRRKNQLLQETINSQTVNGEV